MHKFIRYILYINILLLYNITTLYSSSVHNHQFSWTEVETCSAYIISISQKADTFPLLPDRDTCTPNISYLDVTKYNSISDLEFLCNISQRAPPSNI